MSYSSVNTVLTNGLAPISARKLQLCSVKFLSWAVISNHFVDKITSLNVPDYSLRNPAVLSILIAITHVAGMLFLHYALNGEYWPYWHGSILIEVTQFIHLATRYWWCPNFKISKLRHIIAYVIMKLFITVFKSVSEHEDIRLEYKINSNLYILIKKPIWAYWS